MKATIMITRQMGSGGSFLGKLIADQLGIKYIDREILYLAAQEFGVEPEILMPRAEKLSSFWQKALRGFDFGSPYSYIPPPLPVITDQKLFDKQTEIMKMLAKENNCLIVGWGATFVLPRHNNTMTIFCHAPIDFRIKRVKELYQAQDEKSAATMIAESDEIRKKYIAQMTGKDWECLNNYDLSINTSLLSIEKIANLIIEVVRQKGIIISS